MICIIWGFKNPQAKAYGLYLAFVWRLYALPAKIRWFVLDMSYDIFMINHGKLCKILC